MGRLLKRLPVVAAPFLALGLAAASPLDIGGAYSPIATIAVPGAPLTSFDISFVDPVAHRYYLADRANKGVDIFNTTTNTFLKTIPGFVGIVLNPAVGTAPPTVNNDASGPNGLVPVGSNELWVGDGKSLLQVVDLTLGKITDTIPTGGVNRADEIAYDPVEQLVAIANDAEAFNKDGTGGPFLTFVSTKPGHAILGKIPFSDATNGLEQPQYDKKTGLIYISVPQVGDNYLNGVVRVIDPKTITVVRDIKVTGCQPAGLTQGPRQQFLIGCGALPAVPPADPSTGSPANTQIISGITGATVKKFPGVGGTDQAWYNPGNQTYFTGSGNNPAGPLLGIISAFDNTLVQTIPTNTGSHSVAADSVTNNVYVPFRPTTAAAYPNCTNGCIEVYGQIASPLDKLIESLLKLTWK